MSSLYSSINSGISGLNAQSMAMSSTASNISNINSVGYKGTRIGFRNLISGGESSAGSVMGYGNASINISGQINHDNYNAETNMAIDGSGMFAVNTQNDNKGKVYFTRNGSFIQDENGNLKNSENVFLMAWKPGDENQDKVESLEVVNLSNIADKASPTSKIHMSMNLDAGEENATSGGVKARLNSIHNTNLNIKDIIAPDGKLQVGDAINIANGQGTSSTFSYGGFIKANVVSDTINLLGANKSNGAFNALKEGEKFIINTASTGDVVFSYSSNADTSNGIFNSLNTLAEAINYKEGYSAKVIDDNLYITPSNANEGMSFSNFDTDAVGLSKNLNGVFLQDAAKSIVESVVLSSSNQVFQAANATSTFSGLTTNDKITIKVSDGTQYTMSYSSTPSVPNGTFNNLQTLAAAINAVPSLDAAVVNSNQLRLNTADVSQAIMSISSSGANDVAASLGLKIDSLFRGSATAGDKMTVAFGGYDHVTSSKINFDLNTNLGSLTKITGTKSLNDVGGILGSSSAGTSFTGINDGDKLTFITSAGTKEYAFRATAPNASAATKEFNNLNGLVAVINSDTATSGLTASINNGALEITVGGGKSLSEIKSSVAAGADFSEALGLKFSQILDNESLDIVLDSGEKSTFVFKNTSNPDGSKGQFNSMTTLKSAINSAFKGKIAVDYVDNALDFTLGNKLPSSIYSISGNVAKKLNILAQSNDLKLTFKGTTTAPNTVLGEFNDLFTLREAINKSSGGLVKANITDLGSKIAISANYGGKIKYISEENINGISNFASNMGLKSADLVTALGLRNTKDGSGRFSTLDGLANLVNEVGHLKTEKDYDQIKIFANNVLDVLNFSNESTNSADLVALLGLPAVSAGPAYSALDSEKNLASGKIKPSFASDITVYDALGGAHDLRMGFLKFDDNFWGFELFTNAKNEINNNRLDGLLASGQIKFGSGGVIENMSFEPVMQNSFGGENALRINWTNGAAASDIILDLGKKFVEGVESASAGLRQFYGGYNVNQFEQDGSKMAILNKVLIDENGYINALFDNGEVKSVYRVPLAVFDNPNALSLQNGNLYFQTIQSGDYSLKKVGESGSGQIFTKALELSNVDLSTELQNLMSINQMYQSCLKILHTANSLINELNKMVGY